MLECSEYAATASPLEGGAYGAGRSTWGAGVTHRAGLRTILLLPFLTDPSYSQGPGGPGSGLHQFMVLVLLGAADLLVNLVETFSPEKGHIQTI